MAYDLFGILDQDISFLPQLQLLQTNQPHQLETILQVLFHNTEWCNARAQLGASDRCDLWRHRIDLLNTFFWLLMIYEVSDG